VLNGSANILQRAMLQAPGSVLSARKQMTGSLGHPRLASRAADAGIAARCHSDPVRRTTTGGRARLPGPHPNIVFGKVNTEVDTVDTEKMEKLFLSLA